VILFHVVGLRITISFPHTRGGDPK